MWLHSVMKSILFQYAEYSFKVFPVVNCPMSKESWESASTRRKCNSTQGYHCVPNKQFTSLIEFCYPKGSRFPFEAGIHTYIYLEYFFCFFIFGFYLVCLKINCVLKKGIWKTRIKCNIQVTLQRYVQEKASTPLIIIDACYCFHFIVSFSSIQRKKCI